MILRARTPDETIKVLEPHLYKAAITRIADLTQLDDTSSLTVFSAIRPAAKSISISMGKSLNSASAKCGSIVESFETYLAEEVTALIKSTSYKELNLKSKLVIKTHSLGSSFIITDDYPLDWCSGYQLDSKKEVYIPLHFLSLNSNKLINQFCSSNSDGIASGNNLEEALVCSLLEKIERIAVKENKRQLINLDEKILYKYNLNDDYILNFFEYENNFQIPVVGVEIYNKYKYSNQCIYCGFAAANSYENAIYRALEEALQTKIGVISGARDDLIDEYYCFDNTVKSQRGLVKNKGLYKEITYDNTSSFLKVIKKIISNLGYNLIVFEYFNDNFYVVKTFIVNSENIIL